MNKQPKQTAQQEGQYSEIKTFLGNLKWRERKNGQTLITGIMYLGNIQDIPQELIKKDANGNFYFPVAIVEKRNVDAMGNTHIIKVDMFKPQPNGNSDK